MRLLFTFLLSLATLAGYAQAAAPMALPPQALSHLEDLMERTKQVAANHQQRIGKHGAETHPEVNRYLVLAADDFVRVTKDKPSPEAYLEAMDKGLTRVAPLASTKAARQQVADYYMDLMEIVGLPSSEGKLLTFIEQAPAK